MYWDLRSTILKRHTGVGKHVINVLNGLIKETSVEICVLLARDQIKLWQTQSVEYGWTHVPTQRLSLSHKMIRLLSAFGLLRDFRVIRSDCDFVYSPMELSPPILGLPFVTTIHGLPFFESVVTTSVRASIRAWFERVKQAAFFWRCRRSGVHAFTVSEYLRKRLISEFGWSKNDVFVVGNGVESSFFVQTDPRQRALKTVKNGQIQLLQVGGANAFDGAESLFQVACYLQKHYPETTIRIVGDFHCEPWVSRLNALPNIIWLGFLNSDRLLAEMQTASALLYVPDVESFGIIGAEAMACGLPILARPTTALPEVLGDAAHWFQPADFDSLERALSATCFDSASRQILIQRGFERVSEMTWTSVVQRILKSFDLVVNCRQELLKSKDLTVERH